MLQSFTNSLQSNEKQNIPAKKEVIEKTQLEIIGVKSTAVKNIIIDNKIKVAGRAHSRQNGDTQ